ncbi:hypothetical protein OTERR_22030 [Oryzomicrobium terrae]|uniref:Autotransporter domain-containing protein n=2 Tax=Oryzomicrobium terrae TaxID=1735038 RepID=A0A5C1EAM8_9RHOO|nr:hypothetical protein OTERR_22030 [Oryzomicrobium terrae]
MPFGKSKKRFTSTPTRIAILLAWVGTPCFAAGFSLITPPPDYTGASIAGMSGDGSVLVGTSSDMFDSPRATLWRNFGTSPTLLPPTESEAAAVSADGRVVVGTTYVDGVTRAWRWNNDSIQDLDPLGTDPNSRALGLSSDGRYTAGSSTNYARSLTRAVLWDGSAPPRDLSLAVAPLLPGMDVSEAVAVSTNGRVVAGNASAFAARGFVWRDDGSPTGNATLLALPVGYTDNKVVGMSWDGTIVAGNLAPDTASSQATYWTTADNVAHPLGTLPGALSSQATAISGDGKVIIGESGSRAFRWTQATSMQSVAQWLAGAGVSVPAGTQLQRATATNQDGSVIAGAGMASDESPLTWLARISPIGSGLLSDLNAYNATLREAASKTPHPVSAANNLALGGAHHRSLLDSGLAVIQNGACAWATTDAAHHNASNSSMNLAEAGVCKDIGATRLGIGVGQAWARQGWSLGGGARYNGQYVLAEVASNLGRGIEVSLLGYYGRFAANLRRNYQNGAAIDTSRGTSDATSTSLRLRTDWKDAFALATTRFSPYAAYTWMDTRLDRYTETGGGFPARFAATTQRSQDLRLGLATNTPLAASTDLRVAAEAIHRIDETLSGTSSEVIGLWNFTVPGQKAKQNWTRLLVDLDHRIGKSSLINLSATAATSGGDASWGASLGYRMAF